MQSGVLFLGRVALGRGSAGLHQAGRSYPTSLTTFPSATIAVTTTHSSSCTAPQFSASKTCLVGPRHTGLGGHRISSTCEVSTSNAPALSRYGHTNPTVSARRKEGHTSAQSAQRVPVGVTTDIVPPSADGRRRARRPRRRGCCACCRSGRSSGPGGASNAPCYAAKESRRFHTSCSRDAAITITAVTITTATTTAITITITITSRSRGRRE